MRPAPFLAKFTIHYGEIKTTHSGDAQNINLRYLQSTMVRLRRKGNNTMIITSENLQSTMVRLRQAYKKTYITQKEIYNPLW